MKRVWKVNNVTTAEVYMHLFSLENIQPTFLAHSCYSLAYFQEDEKKNACLSIVMLMNVTSDDTGDSIKCFASKFKYLKSSVFPFFI